VNAANVSPRAAPDTAMTAPLRSPSSPLLATLVGPAQLAGDVARPHDPRNNTTAPAVVPHVDVSPMSWRKSVTDVLSSTHVAVHVAVHVNVNVNGDARAHRRNGGTSRVVLRRCRNDHGASGRRVTAWPGATR
jgi:hypothetical protein